MSQANALPKKKTKTTRQVCFLDGTVNMVPLWIYQEICKPMPTCCVTETSMSNTTWKRSQDSCPFQARIDYPLLMCITSDLYIDPGWWSNHWQVIERIQDRIGTYLKMPNIKMNGAAVKIYVYHYVLYILTIYLWLNGYINVSHF